MYTITFSYTLQVGYLSSEKNFTFKQQNYNYDSQGKKKESCMGHNWKWRKDYGNCRDYGKNEKEVQKNL